MTPPVIFRWDRIAWSLGPREGDTCVLYHYGQRAGVLDAEQAAALMARLRTVPR